MEALSLSRPIQGLPEVVEDFSFVLFLVLGSQVLHGLMIER